MKYSTDSTTFQSNATFSGLSWGTYRVWAKNAAGCISNGTDAIINQQPATPSAPGLSVTQPTCLIRTGTVIVITPTDSGTTYNIDNGAFQASTTFSNLNSGSYYIRAKNSVGCVSPASNAVINTAPPIPAQPSVSITQPSCTLSTGSLTVTAPTGSGLTYSINGTSYLSGTTFSPLVAGTYPVTVMNASGCVSPAFNAVINATPNCSAGIYPTAVSCNTFQSGSVNMTEVCYAVSRGKISNVTPGAIFYYGYITAPSSSFTIDIAQTSQLSNFKLFSVFQSNQAILWDAACSKKSTGTQPTTGQARISVTGAIAGRTYIVNVKYDSKSVVGSTISGTPPINTYTFSMKVNGVAVPSSSVSIQMKSSNCTALRQLSGMGIEEYPIIAYPNPTSSSVFLYFEMEEPGDIQFAVFNSIGELVLFREARYEDTGQYNFELPLSDGNLSKGIYLVRVIRNGRVDVIRVVLDK